MGDFEFGLLYSFRNPVKWRMDQKQFYDETIEHIVAMEDAGFDTIWLTEHHFWADGYLPSLAVMTAAVAMVTKKVWIGHSIVELPLHHPVRVAEAIAVADILSGGRVRMGVGLGRMNFDWRQSFEDEGLVFGASNVGRDRARMFEEQIEILKECWADEPFQHTGEFYDFPEIDVTPKPVQPGGPGIWFGVGDQAKKPMDRAARLGNGWTGGAGGLENYLNKVKEHDRMAEAGQAIIFMRQLPAEDPEAAEAKYGEMLAYHSSEYMTKMEGGAQTPTSPGWSGQDVRRESYFAEPAAIAEQLAEVQSRGATGALWFAPITGASPKECIPMFTSLISEVKPQLDQLLAKV